MKKSYKVFLALIACLVIFAGCSNNKNTNNDLYNGSKSDSDSAKVDKFVNPFDQYDLQQSQIEIISNAESVLADKCMKKLGFANGNKFPKFGIGIGADNPPVDFTNYNMELGPLTLEYASKFGYLSPGASSLDNSKVESFDGKEWKETKLVSITELKGNDAKQYDALKNKGGCEDQANKEVSGNLKLDQGKLNDIERLKGDALETTKDNKTFIKLNTSWVDCMHKKGFNYDSFKKPIEKFYGAGSSHSKTISSTEKKTAIADFKCKQQTNLLNTYRQLLQQNQQNIINKNIVLFNEVKDYYQQKLERAQKIISENE